MLKALVILNRLAKDEDGASLVEYTVLLGILLVAVITTIVTVGGWVSAQWAALSSGISSTN
ncbi:Flp family type IVb pilin [Methylovirgula sp. 4M-Z18]|uniref:Flp family type IVb pilin n=1 Tax=Methylovirgula sp. 4M-Z18 TaxID=2293567 RepID=UPI001FE0EAE3|nr:Flp family type IVb pilin [Methylovirgula sp. 4M-Z18]